MVKWRILLDSARQIGLETTFESFLIVVGSGIAGAEEVQAEFFALKVRKCSGTNQ